MRFPGFSGEWEVKRLGEISQINPKNENLPNLFTYIDLESVINGLLLKEEIISKNEAPSRAQRVLVKKDILFQMVRPYQKNNLFFDKDGEFVASTGYAQIRTDQTPQFIFQYLHTQKFVDKVIERCTGTSYPAINSSDLGNIQIHYPNSKEQNKIARFLGLLDERIQTQSKIIEGLKTLKTTVAKKIFSQQLRFKDDKGNDFPEWEIKKLGEIFYSEKGKGISKNKINSIGKYECVLYGELYTKYKEVIFDVLSKTNEVDGLKSQVNDLLIPSSTTTTGIDLANVTAINKDDVLLGGDITVLRTKEKINNIFYAYYLSNHKKEEISNYAQGSTIIHLYYSHIKEMLIDLPILKEQTKIANSLLSIDAKIDVENELFRKLEKQKKFLLQNLFV